MKAKLIPRIDIHDRKERKLLSVLSCPNCGILKQGVPEDLDEFSKEILDRM
ncbi:hypothetical protein P261_02710 [Lachnospiraceae bacterium TWA4]|nr:hypothetical protein P261_02710 [Lachnospiraceae bacterium TWA4]